MVRENSRFYKTEGKEVRVYFNHLIVIGLLLINLSFTIYFLIP